MKVLVTGHRGYIGSVMTAVLQHAGHDVVGLDCDLYRGCDFGRTRNTVPDLDRDVRDVECADLRSFDAVIHLAALSSDAVGELDPGVTEEINFEATLRLAQNGKRAGVGRFLFASSCSVYGRGGYGPLTEQHPTRPLSAYAKTKLRCERELGLLADDSFSPVLLRNATVFGVSPRLRLDLVVNDFVASAVANGRIVMATVGHAWRPLIHVVDLARVYLHVLTAPREVIHNRTFNVVAAHENHRVIDMADAVTEHVSDCTRASADNVVDPRSYRADGSTLRRALPELTLRWSLVRGIKQLRDALHTAGLSPGDWRCDRYRRALRLTMLRERGELDADLRRRPQRVSRRKAGSARRVARRALAQT